MSLMKGIVGSDAPRDSVYMRAGRYLNYLSAFKSFKNRKGADRVAFENIVVAVLDDTLSHKDPKGAHREGDRVSWVVGDQDGAMASAKGALLKITGIPDDQLTEEVLTNLTGAAQPLAGMFIEWESDVRQSKAGTPYTAHRVIRRWSAEEVEKAISPELLKSLKLDTSKA